jgi:uncharacterized membrane protein YeiH
MLRWARWLQVLIIVTVIAVLTLAVTKVVDDWSDWVVLGMIVFTTIGGAVAIHHRQYPTKKRTFTRDADSEW